MRHEQGDQARSNDERRRGDGNRGQEMTPTDAGDEQHNAAHRCEQHGRAPVRFRENQHQDNRDENPRKVQAANERAHEPLIAIAVVRQNHDHGDLCQLGRLKALSGQMQPAAGTASLNAETGNQHQDQQ